MQVGADAEHEMENNSTRNKMFYSLLHITADIQNQILKLNPDFLCNRNTNNIVYQFVFNIDV